jgi:hypothetical protein
MNAIPLNQVNYRRIENYARLTGQPVSAVLEEALTFWMDAMGDPVLEELQRREIEAAKKRSSGKLLSFPPERE